MKPNITIEELKAAIREIYTEYGASGIETTEAGETVEHFEATLDGINSAVIMLTTLLFSPSDEEMDEVEKLCDAGREYAIDMVRNHYQRIVSQIH